MKSTANHIIHKQTIDIRFPDFNAAHKWGDADRAKMVEAVRTCIERCFEEYDSTREYLTIDKLEFDLGSFSANQLLTQMPEKFYEEFQKVLSSYRVNLHDFEGGKVSEDVPSINVWSTPGAEKRIAGPIVRNSEITAFLHFLQHGHLPWWYANEPAWNLEWIQELTEHDWKELRTFLNEHKENEFHNETALFRLISQFSDEFLASLLNGLKLKELVDKGWKWLQSFYQALQKAETNFSRNENSLPTFSAIRQLFWKKWIRYALGKSALPELGAFLALVKKPLLITDFLSEIKGNSDWMDSVPDFWYRELIGLRQGELNIPEINASKDSFSNAKSEKLDKEDFILIPDSGLVLLHPFLPRFFEYCSWMKENDFLNDEARYRAINALHYLSAGDEEAPEYVLMLPKLLCGIPLEWPIEPMLPLVDKEREACDELLVQVIGHWSALRNASPTALRETFLCRDGKLFLTDDGWRLEVQRKTEDILVDRLPWGFSMIKYSWMPRLLSVTWE